MSKRKKISMEETLPLILSASGALGIFPFAVIRFLNGEWASFALDAGIVVTFFFLGISVYRTGKVRGPSILLAMLCVVGVISSVYLTNPGRIYWAYPAIVGVFYLLEAHEALVLTALSILVLAFPLSTALETIDLATVLVTLLVTAGFSYTFAMLTQVQKDKLVHLATRDPLTDTGNRRALDEKLPTVIAARKRSAEIASLLIIDLDHFKSVNDEHGHAAGDHILVRISEVVKQRIRATDSLYRIGGEEFVVLAEGQDIARASQLAEQLRTLVEVNDLAPGQNLTISIGVAELRDGESCEQWLRRADDALYEAKRAGRNTTSIAKIAIHQHNPDQ